MKVSEEMEAAIKDKIIELARAMCQPGDARRLIVDLECELREVRYWRTQVLWLEKRLDAANADLRSIHEVLRPELLQSAIDAVKHVMLHAEPVLVNRTYRLKGVEALLRELLLRCDGPEYKER